MNESKLKAVCLVTKTGCNNGNGNDLIMESLLRAIVTFTAYSTFNLKGN